MQQKNRNKILCHNNIKNKICTYGTKCHFAHSLAEQCVDPLRHKVYYILKNNNNLSHIDLINDDNLFKTMIELTKVCTSCSKKCCPGGYNCMYGAINESFQICYLDLIYGTCNKPYCNKNHLVKDRGLIPYKIQQNGDEDLSISNSVWKDTSTLFFNNSPKREYSEKESIELPNTSNMSSQNLTKPLELPPGLYNFPEYKKTPERYNLEKPVNKDIFIKYDKKKANAFFKDLSKIKLTDKITICSDSTSSDDDVEMVKRMLNEASDNDTNESIFLI